MNPLHRLILLCRSSISGNKLPNNIVTKKSGVLNTGKKPLAKRKNTTPSNR